MRRIFVFMSLFLLLSCQRDDSDIISPGGVIVPEPEHFFDSQYIGKVQDTYGNTLDDVRINIGGFTAFTSAQGIFILKNVKTSEVSTMIHCSKPGYFDKYISVTKSAGQYTNLIVEMEPKVAFFLFTNSSNTAIDLPGNMTLDVPANSFRTREGVAFQGFVRLYVSYDTHEGQVPLLTSTFKRGVLDKAQRIHFSFETNEGGALEATQPLTLHFDSGFRNIAMPDKNTYKWQEVKSDQENNTVSIMPDKELLVALGELVEATKVKTNIVNRAGQGVSFVNMEMNDANVKTRIYATQSGEVEFFAPSGKTMYFNVQNLCGETLFSNQLSTSDVNAGKYPDIVLQDDQLKTVFSDVITCSESLDHHDLVNVQLEGKNGSAVAYQYNNEQLIVVPSCIEIEKATFYRGFERRYSVSFSGNVDMSMLSINAAPLCIGKLHGYYSLGGKEVIFDKDEFTILREGKNKEDLTVTDLSGFVISIPNVQSPGNYKANDIFLTFPEISDCSKATCSEINILVEELGNPGELVKIKMEGKMNGVDFKGSFLNVLKG